jgi:hypothetical protein
MISRVNLWRRGHHDQRRLMTVIMIMIMMNANFNFES